MLRYMLHYLHFFAGRGLSTTLAAPEKAAAPTTLSSWVSMMPGAQALADSMEQDEPVMSGGLNLVVMGPPLGRQIHTGPDAGRPLPAGRYHHR